jgi:hypothetical protein
MEPRVGSQAERQLRSGAENANQFPIWSGFVSFVQPWLPLYREQFVSFLVDAQPFSFVEQV